MEPARMEFPWRQLGELLVDQELLTEDELEQALLEQARSGRLLGQIIVDRGYLSAFSLARVLSEQHGIQVRQAEEEKPQPLTVKLALADPPEFGESAPDPDPEPSWRPLGGLLLEKGLLTAEQLIGALDEQRERHARLGEILVSQGLISGTQLTQLLAEQHGVELEPADDEFETEIMPATPEEPMYKVFDVGFEPGFQRRTAVYESPSFLEAADFAVEYVERHEPQALEIHRTHGAAQETVWNYSASRAAAANIARKSLVDTFGFDPTKWGQSN